VIVNGEARDADRHDALVPGSSAPSEGVAADPFDRQILAAHRFDEIADFKILNRYLAARSQDARTFEQAVTVTATTATTPSSSSMSRFRARRQRHGCERCDSSHLGSELGGRTYEVTARGARRALVIRYRHCDLLGLYY
jgi:hypothetical protein